MAIIRMETESYNEKRYGKPWIAKIDFSKNSKGDYIWGTWTGDHYNGGAGVLEIEANPGDIIAVGQKDFKKPRNSAPLFYVANLNGTMDYIGNKGDAYKYYIENKSKSVNIAALKAEKKELAARMAEIDALLAETEQCS